MYKQIIIARKDLGMSVGKLSAQISHASIVFLTNMIRRKAKPCNGFRESETVKECTYYNSNLMIEKDLYEQWIDGEFTKCVLQAKNKNQLLKAKIMADELKMDEGIDYFLIYDNCRTELTPEEDGKTLTCIGFKPMDSEIIDKIGRKYHLYM